MKTQIKVFSVANAIWLTQVVLCVGLKSTDCQNAEKWSKMAAAELAAEYARSLGDGGAAASLLPDEQDRVFRQKDHHLYRGDRHMEVFVPSAHGYASRMIELKWHKPEDEHVREAVATVIIHPTVGDGSADVAMKAAQEFAELVKGHIAIDLIDGDESAMHVEGQAELVSHMLKHGAAVLLVS